MNRKPYPTDLTDEQWKIMSLLLPSSAPTGRPRRLSLREITDAILYTVRAGCARSLLPHDFPAWQSVYYYSDKRKQYGIWERIHNTLFRETRIHEGHEAEPSSRYY